jgi:hypothetical protein
VICAESSEKHREVWVVLGMYKYEVCAQTVLRVECSLFQQLHDLPNVAGGVKNLNHLSVVFLDLRYEYVLPPYDIWFVSLVSAPSTAILGRRFTTWSVLCRRTPFANQKRPRAALLYFWHGSCFPTSTMLCIRPNIDSLVQDLNLRGFGVSLQAADLYPNQRPRVGGHDLASL